MNYFKNSSGLLIRFDDISENMKWEFMEKCEVLFDEYNIKPVLGVIPNNKDRELLNYPIKENFWELVRGWKKKGWEISMHGYSHVYSQSTKKKDYFGYGGKSEFFGVELEKQILKIKNGLEKFDSEKIKIRTFYAPNHTYDLNTFKALKKCNIRNIVDGYGLMPYEKDGLSFIPQLFYKILILPFGVQSTQIHLNYWEEKDFKNFKNFIEKNQYKILSFDQALSKVNNSLFYKLINLSLEKILKLLRFFNKTKD